MQTNFVNMALFMAFFFIKKVKSYLLLLEKVQEIS